MQDTNSEVGTLATYIRQAKGNRRFNQMEWHRRELGCRKRRAEEAEGSGRDGVEARAGVGDQDQEASQGQERQYTDYRQGKISKYESQGVKEGEREGWRM